MSGDVQIFISYARDDNAPPPGGSDREGFVSHLHEQLTYEFKDHGHPRPKIWRDTRRIGDADQFEPMLEEAIGASSILLVVLSKNWMAREFCRRELESFRRRWSDEGELGIRRRIVVVGKRPVDRERLPSLLQGQVGFPFYALGDPDENMLEHEFFWRGKVRDDRYYEALKRLAAYLARAAERVGRRVETVPETPAAPAAGPAAAGRTVYVAKPANDMRAGYDRIVRELTGRGYAVVPDARQEIPHDHTAVDFVDQAMAAADLSVHLLGTKSGYSPEDAEPIAKLQLARAAARADAPSADRQETGAKPFRRIVWAPKVLEPIPGQPPADGERDPLLVLQSFGRQLDTDKIDGHALSKFVDFLVRDVAADEAPQPRAARASPSGTRVYLYHSPVDQAYAFDLADALQGRAIEAVLPAFDGSKRELKTFHRDKLAECDAVALCWANASEVWVRAQSSDLKDWRVLKRKKQFAYRGVVAGPPPGGRKTALKRLFPPSEIDLIVDLTDSTRPVSDMLDPLVRGVGPDET